MSLDGTKNLKQTESFDWKNPKDENFFRKVSLFHILN